MKIAQLFYGTIPPSGYGGIERMVFWLSRALVQLGHEVVIVASHVGPEVAEAGIEFRPWPDNLNHLSQLLSDVDVMHFHQPFLASFKPCHPYIITEHGNHRGPSPVLPNTVFISSSHAKNHGAKYFVYNGIPLEDYPLQTKHKKGLLFMALLSWTKKNAKTAINLAFDTKMSIHVCGGDVWNEPKIRGIWKWRAKNNENKALINAVGEVDGPRKLELLQKSSLLFYIVNWQEPFALAPHEAMATGTPVLCSPNGALPEYIVDGENGYIVSSYNDARAAIKRFQSLSFSEKNKMYENCRNTAFSILDSAEEYLKAYKKVISEQYLYPPQNAQTFKFKPKKTAVVKHWLEF